MKYLPILFFMSLFSSCSPKSISDFVSGEEKIINQVIEDQYSIPIGLPSSAPLKLNTSP